MRAGNMYVKAAFSVIAAIVLIIIAGAFSRDFFDEKISIEKSNQLTEITRQVGENFANSLDLNRELLMAAKNIVVQREYNNLAEVSAMADWLNRTTEVNGNGGFFILLDNLGRSYDARGTNGIWADYSTLAGRSSAVFIADSRSYEGIYWAFVQKLDKPVAVKDDSGVSLCYVAFLRTADKLEPSFANTAYREMGETYVLKENGMRAYDNINSKDTLKEYNIFAALRSAEPAAHGNTFEQAKNDLREKGISTGECIYNGRGYCYSFYHIENCEGILLFWVPANIVAATTIEMTGIMIKWLLAGMLVLIMIVSAALYFFNEGRNRGRALAQQERANQELARLNADLLASRKAAEQALAIAESANHAKSRFLSSMSHDIRTPLNAILGFQKLISAYAGNPEKIREYAGKISVASGHLLGLINDILDMARIESGKTALNPEPFSLGAIVDELKTIITPQAQAKRQTLSIENKAGQLAVVGDKARLSQILTNLLSNAVKYTQNGGKILFATEQLKNSSNGIVLIRFTVKDNGIGMDEEFQTRIFEPFSREETALVNGIAGTGLGMSITKTLIDLMGGVISVRSRKGEGSTFTVELRFRLADSGDMVQTVDEGKEFEWALEGRHFLVVEDNEVNAEILVELLDMENATCEVAHNGQEAVNIFEKSKPGTYDAILMDVQMPVMDGYEATRCIRSGTHPEAGSIPIVALTANAFAEDVQKAIEAGMNTHIAKPVDIKKLREFMASC